MCGKYLYSLYESVGLTDLMTTLNNEWAEIENLIPAGYQIVRCHFMEWWRPSLHQIFCLKNG